MKVLMITGDKHFASSERYKLQASVVERLEVMYWGRGEMFPRLPKGEFDIVTVQDPFLRGLFAWHVGRKLGAKFNVQVHADFAAQSVIKKVVGRFVLRQADSVRVVSDKIKQQIESLGVMASVHVLPIFVDLERFKAIERQPSVQKTILWIGRFEAEKDPLRAIQVFKEVRAAGFDAKLIMLGKGTLEPALRHVSQGLPVEFAGWQDPVPYLAEASVVLCTSRHESWGASIVETLAAGVPVVAPDVGIAREAGAIVVERSALAQKTIEVLQNNVGGKLLLTLPSANEWAAQWKKSL